MRGKTIELNSVITCCKDCKDRKVGCHGECERYNEQRQIQIEVNKQRRRERLAHSIIIEQVEECKERIRRK